MNFCDLFISIQGEGRRVGKPSIFLRTSGCNLKCVFPGGTICDTPYSSFNPEIEEPHEKVEEDFIKLCELHRNYDVVITGGEPLLWKDEMNQLVKKIRSTGNHYITIETNGTRPPLDEPVDLYSVSIKLKGTVPCLCGKYGGKYFSDLTLFRLENERQLYKENTPEIIHKQMKDLNSYQLKFVYSGVDSMKEIEQVKSELKANLTIPFGMRFKLWFRNLIMKGRKSSLQDWTPANNIMLMPEGITEEQLMSKRKTIAETCILENYEYTDRLHIIIWGDKRGF